VQRAETYLGVDVLQREDVGADDLVDEVTSLAARDCKLIVMPLSIGDVASAVVAAPDVSIVAVDVEGSGLGSKVPNDAVIVTFDAAEAAYLAGYAAAAATETGTMGVIPSAQNGDLVTAFSNGAKAFGDKASRPEVIVLPNGDGEGSFAIDEDDPQAVAGATRTLISRGADIIVPIAGDASLGAVPVVRSAGGVSLVWSGENGCRALPEDCGLFLTSVVSNLDNATFEVIKNAVADDTNFNYVGTLANSGVGIAPFNDYRDRFSTTDKERITELRDQIISGDIEVLAK
jgi:basic membrane protein A